MARSRKEEGGEWYYSFVFHEEVARETNEFDRLFGKFWRSMKACAGTVFSLSLSNFFVRRVESGGTVAFNRRLSRWRQRAEPSSSLFRFVPLSRRPRGRPSCPVVDLDSRDRCIVGDPSHDDPRRDFVFGGSRARVKRRVHLFFVPMRGLEILWKNREG